MTAFFIILKDIILPVFVLIGIGVLIHRKFQIDLYSLAKINVYFVVPSLIFIKLYEAKLSFQLLGQVFLFFILHMALLYVLAYLMSKVIHHKRGMKIAFSNSVIFYNAGNYGVPVNELVFHHPFAMSIQVLVITLQNIFTFSYGVFALKSVKGSNLKALLDYFKLPVFYAMFFGIFINLLEIELPNFIYIPIGYGADALIAVALFTLGAQVANLKWEDMNITILMSVLFRLLLSPVIGYVLTLMLQIDGMMAQTLIIAAAMPTAVNSAIIAQEYENEPEFAAQVVLVSTFISAFTVTLVIYFTRILF